MPLFAIVTSTMKEYLLLQCRMNNRKLRDAGLPPIVGYMLMLAAFIGLSYYLFIKSNYATYIYPFLALTLLSPLSETKRNEFIKTCFGDKRYRQIRIVENLIIVLPFVAFILYKQAFIVAAVVPVFAALMALNTYKSSLQFTTPTPFGSKPYEFTVGFRNTLAFIVIAYILAIIAVVVGNFNLGIFALLAIFAISLSYYGTPEDEYYVWQHSYTPQGFLWMKYKTAIQYVTVLSFPALTILGIAYYTHIHYILLFQLLGYAYIACMIAAKYSAYPSEMNIPQAVLLAISFCFPPALLIVLPYFLSRALQRLQPILK